MSSAVSRAWSWRHAITRSDLRPTTRHVLLNLSMYMDEAGGSCFPSIDQQAKATGLTTKAVKKHLDLAGEAGWLSKRPHGFKGQRWRRLEYEARWPEREADPVVTEGAEPRSVKVGNDIPQDKDQSKDHSTTSPFGRAQARARATRLPDDFCPELREGIRLGLTERQAKDEADRFLDHFLAAPNSKGVKRDWPATWRNWCRRALEWRRQRADLPRRQVVSNNGFVDRFLRLAKEDKNYEPAYEHNAAAGAEAGSQIAAKGRSDDLRYALRSEGSCDDHSKAADGADGSD